MKRIIISKKSAYLLFIPAGVFTFTAAWLYFGPYSLGAFISVAIIFVVLRVLVAKVFQIVG